MRSEDSREDLGLPAPRTPATAKVHSSTPTRDPSQKHTADGTRAWKILLNAYTGPQFQLPSTATKPFATEPQKIILYQFYTRIILYQFIIY